MTNANCVEEAVAAEGVIEWREWVVVIGSVTKDELINEVGRVGWWEPHFLFNFKTLFKISPLPVPAFI